MERDVYAAAMIEPQCTMYRGVPHRTDRERSGKLYAEGDFEPLEVRQSE